MFAKSENHNHRITRFLYWAKNGKPYDENPKKYPVYFFYGYGITDMPGFFRTMIKQGYVEPIGIGEKLKKIRVADLRQILQDNGLPAKGKKEDLLNRIVQAVPQEKIPKNLLGRDIYIPSKKGIEFIRNNSFYDFLTVKKYCIEWSDFECARRSITSFVPSAHDIAWAVLNNKTIEYLKSMDFGMYRNIFLSKYRLLHDEGRDELAFVQLLCAFYLDLSGWENAGKRVKKDDAITFALSTALPGLIYDARDALTETTFEQVFRHIGAITSYIDRDQFEKITRLCICNRGLVKANMPAL